MESISGLLTKIFGRYSVGGGGVGGYVQSVHAMSKGGHANVFCYLANLKSAIFWVHFATTNPPIFEVNQFANLKSASL